MNKISFCIPSKNNLRYLKTAIHYLRTQCVDKTHEILVWIDADADGTSEYLRELNDPNLKFWINENPIPFGIGNAYDFLVKNATHDLVMMYHADMIAGESLDEEILAHHKRGAVVSATRIEPPLHPPEPCKITEDFGLWPEVDIDDGFQEKKFNIAIKAMKTLYRGKITPGVFAPWLIHKEDYAAVGGHDFRLNSLAEDNDIFNRLSRMGITFVQTWGGMVYHLTCRGGQFEHATTTNDLRQKSIDWNILSHTKTREFIRKWGYPPMSSPLKEPIVWPDIKVSANITGWSNTLQMYKFLEFLEPYFSHIVIDNGALVQQYISKEQPSTHFDLTEKFSETTDGMVVSFDIRRVTEVHFQQFLTQLPLVLSVISDSGTYEYDIFTIKV